MNFQKKMFMSLAVNLFLAVCAENVHESAQSKGAQFPSWQGKGPGTYKPIDALLTHSRWKVGVVGSSLVRGEYFKRTVPRARGKAIPEYLHEFLLHKYDTGNFAVDQSTFFQRGSKPYLRFNSFNHCIQWQPEVVIVETGGYEDTEHWNQYLPGEFEREVTNIVTRLRMGIPKVKIFLVIPPPVYMHPDPNQAWIRNRVVMEKLFTVADSFPQTPLLPKVDTINLNRLFREHCPHDGNGYYTLEHEPQCDWMVLENNFPNKQGAIHIALEMRNRVWEWMDTTPGRKKKLEEIRRNLPREEMP